MKQSINCTTGEVTIVDYTDEEKAAAVKMAEDADKDFTHVRNSRNQQLANCDWTQGADSPLTDAEKGDWATYRQQLRDYPAQSDRVSTLPDWPTPPA